MRFFQRIGDMFARFGNAVDQLLAGRRASGEIFDRETHAAKGRSGVVLYRPLRFPFFLGPIHIKVDGKEAGVLRQAGFIAIELLPGEHLVHVRVGRYNTINVNIENVTVTVEPGEFHYFRLSDAMLQADASAYMTNEFSDYPELETPELVPVDSSVAQTELSGFRGRTSRRTG
ncbi:MAG: hypothetical protein R3270_03600 [Gammaproteobacteria bacterium]|nr:hypothetical protein [Gammaproteobacteria bacterium]